MRESEQRYRRQGGETPQYEVSNNGDRSGDRPVARKPVLKTTPKQPDKVTYDDYVEHVSNVEKIIDIDERSRWRTFVDTTDDYKEWVGVHWQRFKVYSKKKNQLVRSKQPTVTEFFAAQNKRFIHPLYERFGRKNVQYVSVSAVLGVFGLLAINSIFFGPGSVEIVDETAVLGGSSTQPTFEVAKPTNVPDEQPVFFDPELGTASYSHEIDGTPVVISQQLLSEEQKQNRANELGKIATTLSADASFESKFGRTYISNPVLSSSNDASQVVIFMTDDLLIFIRNDSDLLEPQTIADYILDIQT